MFLKINYSLFYIIKKYLSSKIIFFIINNKSNRLFFCLQNKRSPIRILFAMIIILKIIIVLNLSWSIKSILFWSSLIKIITEIRMELADRATFFESYIHYFNYSFSPIDNTKSFSFSILPKFPNSRFPGIGKYWNLYEKIELFEYKNGSGNGEV